MNVKKFLHFVGPQVFFLFVLGAAVGLLLSLVELAFAFTLQAFLLVLGITSVETLRFPDWLLQTPVGLDLATRLAAQPELQMVPILILFFSLAFLRGMLQWSQIFFQESAQERFKAHQRKALIRWAFASDSANSVRTLTLFGERTNFSGMAMTFLTASIVYFTTNLFLGASLFLMAPKLTLMAGLLVLIIALPMRSLNRRIAGLGKGLAEEWEATQKHLVVGLRNLLFLRIMGRTAIESGRAELRLRSYLQHVIGYQQIAGFLFASPQVVGIGLMCLVALMAKKFGEFEAGILLSYFYLFIRFVQNSAQLVYSTSNAYFQWPQLRELWNWHHENVEVDRLNTLSAVARKASPSEAVVSPISWKVADLSFRYAEAHPWILRDLNLELRPRECLVLLGPSGSGKTTLLYLLLGLLKPTRGQVSVDSGGESVPSQVLHQIGYVGPEPFLIDGTLRENLYYGIDSEPSREEVERALDLADCGFVRSLTGGLEHRLTEQGMGLSAGQKQRLALARALLRKPRALVLDEVTANVDIETEERLVETLLHLKGQMTIVAVTHRRPLLRIADQVLELGAGKHQWAQTTRATT